MTLQQQAIKEVQVLPDEKLPSLIKFARSLRLDSADETSSSRLERKPLRKIGRLKGEIKMSDDFNETPIEFKEYL